MFINQKWSPLLLFSALCDIFRKRKIFENFKFFSQKNVLRFLSLRYSADFRRSRLVYPRSTVFLTVFVDVFDEFLDFLLGHLFAHGTHDCLELVCVYGPGSINVESVEGHSEVCYLFRGEGCYLLNNKYASHSTQNAF